MPQGPFAVGMRRMAFSISVHHGHTMPVLLKAIIQIFKNSVFSFIIYSHHCFTHTLSASVPILLTQLTLPISSFLCGPGRLMKIWRGYESSLHIPTKKMTVTKIERDQIGQHPPWSIP